MSQKKIKKNKANLARKPVGTYLDYASATPISPMVQAAMDEVRGLFANPGGIHALSLEAAKAVSEARKTIARAIEARPEEIVFTGSATEANTLAVWGAVETWQSIYPDEIPHVIVSAVEHASIMEIARQMEEAGIEVTKLGVNEYGLINLEELAGAIKPNTVVVSVIMANNEIGTIEPIDEVVKIIRRHKKEMKWSGYPLVHTDAAQAFQYLPLRAVKPEVDLMTISSSKIYGPRGIALLYVKNRTPLLPLMPGGGQESGRRGGTEATGLIVGFAKAVEETVALRSKEKARLQKILDKAKKELTQKIPESILRGHPNNRLPNNLTFSVPGIESDYLVLELSAKKFYASSRSACGRDLDSHVIMAIGGDPNDGTIRISMGRQTTEKDVINAIKAVAESISKWRAWSHAHRS